MKLRPTNLWLDAPNCFTVIGQNNFEYLYKRMVPSYMESLLPISTLHVLEKNVSDESCHILGIPSDRRAATQLVIDKDTGDWRRVKCGLVAYELAELNHERDFFDRLGKCEEIIATAPFRDDNCLGYPWFYEEGYQLLVRMSNRWMPVSTGPLSLIYNNGVVLVNNNSGDSFKFIKNWFSAFFPGIIFMTYAEWNKCDIDLKRYLLLADIPFKKASEINPLLLINDVSPIELFNVDKSLLESLKKRDSLPEGVKFSLDLWSNYG